MKLPSPAMIVSLIALFIALGGTSYAVTQLPRNSVGTEQVKDRSLLASDFKSSEIGKLKGTAGSKGNTGETGARGQAGANGTAGSNGTNGTNGAPGADGAPGTNGAPGADGAQTVVDGNGSTLGDLIAVTDTFPSGSIYIVRIGARLWKVDSNGKFLSTGGNLVWTNSSCSGSPIYMYGQYSLTRNSGAMHSPIVNTYSDGTAVAYDVPNDMTSVVVPPNTVWYYKYGDKSCNATGGGVPYNSYGSSALTPVSLPTLVPPLTIG